MRVPVLESNCRDDLRFMVANVLREKSDSSLGVDDDEFFVLRHMGQRVLVRVREEQPAVVALVAVAFVIELIVHRSGQLLPRSVAVVAAMLALTAAVLFVGRS